jgi:hypothetical protein
MICLSTPWFVATLLADAWIAAAFSLVTAALFSNTGDQP